MPLFWTLSCLRANHCTRLHDLSSLAACLTAPQEKRGGVVKALNEVSVPTKGGKIQLVPETSVGPSHASWDEAKACLCQETCRDSSDSTAWSSKTSWKKEEKERFFFFVFKWAVVKKLFCQGIYFQETYTVREITSQTGFRVYLLKNSLHDAVVK